MNLTKKKKKKTEKTPQKSQDITAAGASFRTHTTRKKTTQFT